MKIAHEFRLSGRCPVDGTVDHYDVRVETTRFLAVETMLEVGLDAVSEPRWQEDVARLISNRLGVGVVVRLTGTHSGVETTVEAGPGWEKEIETPA